MITGSVIMTFPSGLYVNPLALDPDDVRIEDIAHHLSRQNRFSGATRGRYGYSVAQHVVLTAQVVREITDDVEAAFVALHHDDAEAYLQDCVRPLKEDPYFGKAYRGAEMRAEKVIASALGIQWPWPPIVKQADLMMLARERDVLLPPNGSWEILEGVARARVDVYPWEPDTARRAYLMAHKRLMKERDNG